MAKMQVETQYEMDQAHFVAAKELGQEMEGNDAYKDLMVEAMGIASQLSSLDMNSRMEFLGQLKLQNYTMYLLASKILDESSQAAMQEQQGQPSGGQQGQPPGGQPEQAPAEKKQGVPPPKGQGGPT